MSSAFYTDAARNALQILQSADKEVQRSQNALSSGMTVANAADNPAIWAIAENMRSDLAVYSGLSDGLAIAETTVSVARTAAEEVTSLLTQIETQITASTAVGADTNAIQDEIDDLVSQIQSVVSAASYNGVNLLQNRTSSDDSTFSVVSNVSTSGSSASTDTITVNAQDLQTTALSFGGTAATATDYFSDASEVIEESGSGTNSADFDIATGTAVIGASYRMSITGASAHAFGTSAVDFEYVAREGDDASDVAQALYQQVQDHIDINGLSSSMSVSYSASSARVTVTNLDTDAADTLTVTNTAATGGVAGGALSDLTGIDVTTSGGRTSALVKIDTLQDVATSAASLLGSSESRVQSQASFIQSMASLTEAGIGALVDADLEQESARLAAAQAQQQIALEMLSIANEQQSRVLQLFQN